MTSAIRAATLLIAISSGIWAILYLAFRFLPGLEVAFYPQYTLPLAVLLPILTTRHVANILQGGRASLPPKGELALFVALSVLGAGAAAYLVEAAILHTTLSQQQTVSFAEILTAPFAERYSIRTLFELSFFASATLVIAYTALFRVPIRLLRTTGAAQQPAPTSEG